MTKPAPGSIPSPCRDVCVVDRAICTGCGRTLQEIAAWPTAPDTERAEIVKRAAARIVR